MIASVIESLGVDMGEEKLPPHHTDNRFGYFEDIDFPPINDEILINAGGSWIDPPAQHRIMLQKNQSAEKIDKLISKKHRDKIWGWKDPRTALTIELFLPHLTNPHFIVIKRDFRSVAKSLKVRNEEPDFEYLYLLAEEYNSRIDNFLSNHHDLPRLRLEYEDVLKYPKKNVRKIELFLGYNFSLHNEKKALNNIRPEEKRN